MTYSVYQHWDPLKVCVVGRSYPPEFYSWISVPHVRALFEQIATETEEDYQGIIALLEKFGVQVLRPDLVEDPMVDGKFAPPPMTPRDHMVMIGNTFYNNYKDKFRFFYNSVKDPAWPDCDVSDDFDQLPDFIKQECVDIFGLDHNTMAPHNYSNILKKIIAQGNPIKHDVHNAINGAMVT
jgi:hypothetical protein